MFSPPLKKSIVFLKYALKMDLAKGEWFNLYFLLEKLSESTSVEDLWEYYKDSYKNLKYPVKFSFDQFITALDYLYLIGAVKMDERGGLYYETA